MIQIRKELPEYGKYHRQEIFDKYRSQYSEKATALEQMYPDEFIVFRHDAEWDYAGGLFYRWKYIHLGKLHGQETRHSSITFIMPAYTDIFKCIYIPEKVQSAELIIAGNTISTWRKSCHKCEKISYDEDTYHKVNFVSPAMFVDQLTFGQTIIKMSTTCDHILVENIYLKPSDYDRIKKSEMVLFPEYDSYHALYMATTGGLSPIVYDFEDSQIKIKTAEN